MGPDLQIDFIGPFAWQTDAECPSVLNDPAAQGPGIYLWTNNPPSGRLVFYVGETGKSFSARMQDHLRQQLAGYYHVYEPGPFAAGTVVEVWPGAFGSQRAKRLSEFVAKLPELAGHLADFVQSMRFYLAPMDVPQRIRQRVEAALADALRQGGRHLQVDGVRYLRRRADEGALSVRVRVPAEVAGVPEELLA